MKRINAAKGTRRRSFLSNPSTEVGINWACRVSIEHLEQRVSSTTIIRRAVDLYCGHLEVLLEEPSDGPAGTAEKLRLKSANKSQDSLVTILEVLSGPLQSLGSMEADKLRTQPKLIDTLRSDLLHMAHASSKL